MLGMTLFIDRISLVVWRVWFERPSDLLAGKPPSHGERLSNAMNELSIPEPSHDIRTSSSIRRTTVMELIHEHDI